MSILCGDPDNHYPPQCVCYVLDITGVASVIDGTDNECAVIYSQLVVTLWPIYDQGNVGDIIVWQLRSVNQNGLSTTAPPWVVHTYSGPKNMFGTFIVVK